MAEWSGDGLQNPFSSFLKSFRNGRMARKSAKNRILPAIRPERLERPSSALPWHKAGTVNRLKLACLERYICPQGCFLPWKDAPRRSLPPPLDWRPGTIPITCVGWNQRVAGHIFGGLGMHRAAYAAVRHRQTWTLTHVRSGVAVARITGEEPTARAIAEKVAGLTDWTSLVHPSAWRQRCPDLDARFRALVAEHPGALARAIPGGAA